MTKTLYNLGVQLSQIILIPFSCSSEQSFYVQFLWGCRGGERVSLPSCLQSALALSPSYSNSSEGGELRKNSPLCYIFLSHRLQINVKKRVDVPSFTWWWKLWLLFGFSTVLFQLLYFLQYCQPKKFRFPRTHPKSVTKSRLCLFDSDNPPPIMCADSGRWRWRGL